MTQKIKKNDGTQYEPNCSRTVALQHEITERNLPHAVFVDISIDTMDAARVLIFFINLAAVWDLGNCDVFTEFDEEANSVAWPAPFVQPNEVDVAIFHVSDAINAFLDNPITGCPIERTIVLGRSNPGPNVVRSERNVHFKWDTININFIWIVQTFTFSIFNYLSTVHKTITQNYNDKKYIDLHER